MADNPRHTLIAVAAKQELTHTNHLVLSLLYMPIIGKDAHVLYGTLHALLDRSSMRSAKYPLDFIYDITDLTPHTLKPARQKLEACGLIETYKDEEGFTVELYQPMSADAFIKDSPFGAYLKHEVGEARYNDLIGHFKITRPQKAEKKNISVAFDEVFAPLADDTPSPRAAYTQDETHKVSYQSAPDIELVLEGLPQSLRCSKMKTKRFKEKLQEIAHMYRLSEKDLSALIKHAHTGETVDIDALVAAAQDNYRNSNQSIHKTTPENSLQYFKRLHPREFLETSTGTGAAKSELATLERLISESGLKHEVINVLIAYVLHQLDNAFPSYNYFEKVATEWKRSDVSSAEMAVEHIKKRKRNLKEKQQRPQKRSYTEKPEDTKVDWFDDYMNNQEE